jgi:hypothetical protein
MVSMDGPFFECSLLNMSCIQLYDLVKELNIPSSSGSVS